MEATAEGVADYDHVLELWNARSAFRWLPNPASNKNWIAGIPVGHRPPDPPPPALTVHRDPGQRAREWQRALESGEIKSRAELARREGVSRARVTQLLRKWR